MDLISLEQLNTTSLIWVGIFVACWLVQLFYWFYFFLRLARPRNVSELQNNQPVSIIICAKNEEKNLMECIPHIMEQDHRNFELIVVNDSSWDDTEVVLKALQVSYPLLRVINLNEEKQNMHGKKFALTLGIKAAKFDTILLTDADCRPSSHQWISKMSSAVENKQEIKLGFSPYRKYPGWLNKIIRFDAWMIGVQYLSFARAGVPYMGVGRNLMYDRKLFFRLGGFKNHYHIASGDDDLLVNEAANKWNTGIEISPESQTISEPKKSWGDWFRQKKRHFTTAPLYKATHKRLLMLLPLSYAFMWIALAGAIITLHPLWILSVFILIRIIVQIAILHSISRKMGQSDLVWVAPIAELKLAFLNAGLYISNLVLKPKKWN